MEKLLLASGSPRRRELLDSLGIGFEALASDVDESIRDYLPPSARVLALAEDKARASASAAPSSAPRLVLGADTLVSIEDPPSPAIVLGKPSDEADARAMIRLIQGRKHLVHTGIALVDRVSGSVRTALSSSTVSFSPMDGTEIEEYLSSGDWEGAAGAYRIQGLAALYIDKLEGSWSCVVGLPIRELYVILRDAEFRVPIVSAR